ncbi:GNAT family N-acetyltransferase [Salinibacterium sp. SYSU T00001]|uniref:GNAT family N-acetyltransferase n=1 Tax=Homoserinimonas sedimenticola TaxID=2986805 RepID=UPI0022358097|nr:GNAT family N-acetyltransferase [Salinibacterium sedimenticola]MCW4385038.1 GNAT family N-acetyltransferase [Salinibacterium sedimenticola]
MKRIRLVKYRVFEWRDAPEKVTTSLRGVELSPITPGNSECVQDFRGPAVARRFANMADSGQIGLYARINGRVVGHGWVTAPSDRRRRVNGYFDLEPHEALIHFCAVDPEYRGHRIFGLLLHELARVARSKDLNAKVLVDTESENSASIKGIEAAGFNPSFDLVVWRVGRWAPYRGRRVQ